MVPLEIARQHAVLRDCDRNRQLLVHDLCTSYPAMLEGAAPARQSQRPGSASALPTSVKLVLKPESQLRGR